LSEFESRWRDKDVRLAMLPGKDALSRVNEHLQKQYGVTVTPTAIIDAMKNDEVPREIESLLVSLEAFAQVRPGSRKG
jgi:hypothetical protein